MRRRKRLAAAGAALLAATTASCGVRTAAGAEELVASDVVRVPVPPYDATAVPDVVSASDRLGLQILDHTPVGANAVTSPASAVVALGMLAEGARGTTLADLDRVLGAQGQDRSHAVNALTAALSPLDGDPAVVGGEQLPSEPVVHLANQVVVDDGLQVRQPYLDALMTSYGAGVRRTDLASPEGGAVLDAWVAEHTGGLVEQSAIEPTPDLRLVLQDAVVLAARWEHPFPASSTSSRPFTLPGGQVVQVETMSHQLPVATAEVAGWTVARLMYQGGTLHADLVLPPAGVGAHELDPSTLAALDAAVDAAPTQDALVELPTLALSAKTDLQPLLERLVPSLMTGPDLSGISDQDLLLGQAVQQAVLGVDEDGTVAGAVTEISFAQSGPPVRLAADRPFLLRVAAVDTGWTLFLARVDDPRPADG